mmetsp:Transcript_9363/g.28649  ORF Transcript_9363/g.28649 Transcript_9363/m.28649 type:complete len:137 (-) Transcript_9363:246-656(-)
MLSQSFFHVLHHLFCARLAGPHVLSPNNDITLELKRIFLKLCNPDVGLLQNRLQHVTKLFKRVVSFGNARLSKFIVRIDNFYFLLHCQIPRKNSTSLSPLRVSTGIAWQSADTCFTKSELTFLSDMKTPCRTWRVR